MATGSRFNTLTLKATLRYSNPAIWRRILIPAGFNCYQLHLALQAAFGWENSHLFQFGKNGLGNDDGGSIGIPDDEFPVKDARKVAIKTLFKNPGDQLVYVYDFGDHWQHDLELEAASNMELYSAFCDGGQNECPPEDVGGMHGYEELVKTFQSGTAAAKREYREWLGMGPKENWDPKRYSQREVNKRMALIAPESSTFSSPI